MRLSVACLENSQENKFHVALSHSESVLLYLASFLQRLLWPDMCVRSFDLLSGRLTLFSQQPGENELPDFGECKTTAFL